MRKKTPALPEPVCPVSIGALCRPKRAAVLLFLCVLVSGCNGTGASLVEEGNHHLERGQFAHAERIYQQAISQEPQNARAHYNLGLALWRQGDVERAEAAFAQSLHLDPEDADSYFQIGLIQYDQNNDGEARKSLEQARRLRPADWDTTLWLARLALKQQDYAGAAQTLQDGARLAVERRMEAAAQLEEQGRFAQALEQLNLGLGVYPGHAELHYRLGILYDTYATDLQKAMGHYREYLRLGGARAEGVRVLLTNAAERAGRSLEKRSTKE